MNEDNRFCVYVHKDKEGVVKYVGSGTIVRAYVTCANSRRGKQYAEYVDANGKSEVEIIAKDLSKLQAEDLERELYDQHKDTILNVRRPNSANLITKKMFDEYLYYDETSPSCLRWKVDVGSRIKANSEAGYLGKSNGYYEVGLQGKYYKVHRIIAVLHDLDVNGKVIDHIDRDKANNKISNLRVVSQKENCQNLSRYKLSSRNTSGTQGVHYNKHCGYWTTSWMQDSKLKVKHFLIKNYQSSEEAFAAACEYRKQMIELH